MKTGATAAGLAIQTKRTDITKEEFLELFGINPDGSLIPGTKADGAIRELIVQISQLAANQEIRLNAIENDLATADIITRLGIGKSEQMFSEKLDKNFVETFIDLSKLPKEYQGKNVVYKIRGTLGPKKDSDGNTIKDDSSTIDFVDRDRKSKYNPKLTQGQHMDQIHNDFHTYTNGKWYDTIMNTVAGGIKRQSYGTKEEYTRKVLDTESKQTFYGRFKYTIDQLISKTFLKRLNKNDNNNRLKLLYDYAKDVEAYLQQPGKAQNAWAFAVLVSDTINNQAGAYTRINIPFRFYLTDKKDLESLHI